MPEFADFDIVLGFDYGTKRIGIALGHTLLQSAKPLETLVVKQQSPDFDKILQLIKHWHAKALIVGIPLNMDGTEQKLSRKARNFSQHLRKHSQLPVFEIDERLSTVEARAQLFEQGGYRALESAQVDSMAAKLILEDWMREHYA